MAKRDSMSKARQSRNRRVTRGHQTESREVDPSAEDLRPVSTSTSECGASAEIVRVEQRRLMKAEAVLRCVAFALLYEDWLEGPNRPCFADAVAVAQDLISAAVVRLGSS
jgi:hypothetical protein